jgi:hypothetical protein
MTNVSDVLLIETADGELSFQPGDVLRGTLGWDLRTAPDALEVRLFWYTRGKGTTDVGVIDSVRFDSPGPRGSRNFQFKLPDAPHSFSGNLISLVWALEALAEPKGVTEAQRVEIVCAPGATEILLYAEQAPGAV